MVDFFKLEVCPAFMSTADAQLARYLSSLCDECENAPATPGHYLCDLCYSRRSSRRRACALCQGQVVDNVCTACELPTEEATYEQLLAWGAERETPMCDSSTVDRCASIEMVAPGEDCAICLDVCDTEQDIVMLGCGHVFHRDCASTAARASYLCAVCRVDMRAHARLASSQGGA